MKLSKVFLFAYASVLLASCGGGGGSSSSTTIRGDSGVPTPSQVAATADSVYVDLMDKGRWQPIKFGSVFQAFSFGYSDVESVEIFFGGSKPSLGISRYGIDGVMVDGNNNRANSFMNSISDQLGIGSLPNRLPSNSLYADYALNRIDMIWDFPLECLTASCNDYEVTGANLMTEYDKTNSRYFVSFGYWLSMKASYNASSTLGFDIDGIEMGVIADGPEFNNPSYTQSNYTGTASYRGPFFGSVTILSKDNTTLSGGAYEGVVNLTADFDGDTIGGCVNCDGTDGKFIDYTSLSASQGLLESSKNKSTDIGLDLTPISLQSDGKFGPGNAKVTGSSISTTRLGEWAGRFSPSNTGVLGIAEASFTERDGSRGIIGGGFYGYEEE